MSSHSTRQWFYRLALLKPATYKPWRHALRLGIGVGLPLMVGWWRGDMGSFLIVALGALLTATPVRNDPYPARFRQIAIATAVALLGFLVGPVVAGHGLMTLVMLAG